MPYVVSPHGTAPLIERRFLAKQIFDATAGRGYLDGAARVLAVSDAERTQLRALGVADSRICVLPNPIDLANSTSPGRLRGFVSAMASATRRSCCSSAS